MDHLHAVMLKTVSLCKGHKLVATPLLVAATHFLFGVAVSALYCYATRKSYFLPCDCDKWLKRFGELSSLLYFNFLHNFINYFCVMCKCSIKFHLRWAFAT